MKKIFALILMVVIIVTLAACGTGTPETTTGTEAATETKTAAETDAVTASAETTTAEETTAEVTTEAEQTTKEQTTAAGTGTETEAPETTTEQVTTEKETTVPETTAPETTKEETTAPETTAEKETTALETTAAETEGSKIPANAYVFDGIYIIKADNYTFKEFSGFPSGLRNGEAEGTCFFNFGTQMVQDPMTEASAKAFLDSMSGQIGSDYTLSGFKSYEVDGHTVTKLDYVWGNGGAIAQSLVKVHFDDRVVQIQMATLTTIPEGVTEFDAMMDTLGIID